MLRVIVYYSKIINKLSIYHSKNYNSLILILWPTCVQWQRWCSCWTSACFARSRYSWSQWKRSSTWVTARWWPWAAAWLLQASSSVRTLQMNYEDIWTSQSQTFRRSPIMEFDSPIEIIIIPQSQYHYS